MLAASRPHLQTTATSRRPIKTCRVCGAGCLTRTARVSFFDYLLSEVGLFPYVCGVCRRRTLRADCGRLVSLSLFVSVTLGLGGYALRLRHGYHQRPQALEQLPAVVEDSRDILSNGDIARMAQVRIPSAVMQRLISSRPHTFQVDSESLISLKKDGVPDDVILTMVTVTLEHPPARSSPEKGPSAHTAGWMPTIASRPY
jgi:hypothetical protein